MSKLRERVVAAIVDGRQAFRVSTEDGAEVDWQADAVLLAVAAWLNERAGELVTRHHWYDGERLAIYRELARELREAVETEGRERASD